MRLTEKSLWWLYGAAAAAFVPTLFLQYVGEEAVTVIVAQEMWARQDFVVTTFYGQRYGRPGMFAWLILPVAGLLGWTNILVAARIVTIAATVLTGTVLAWVVWRIFKDRFAAVFSATVYLSGDVLFYRGWLAYADPLFSLFVFLAIGCVWAATAERRYEILVIGLSALTASFLTKTLTGYLFYGIVVLVLLWRHPNRSFLLHPISIGLHLIACALPIVWDSLVADNAMRDAFLWNVSLSLSVQDGTQFDIFKYLARVIWSPFRTVLYLLPVSAIAIYCLIRNQFEVRKLFEPPIDIAVWTLLLNVPVYWLAPGGGPRYMMPLYPVFALVISFVVLRSAKTTSEVAVKALGAMIVVAAFAHFVGFPLYEHYVRGSYADAAKTILTRTGRHPIYAVDHSSVGVSIVANLNTLRAPTPPITQPPEKWQSGFVVARTPNEVIGKFASTVVVGNRIRYLLCRGDACN